VKTYLTEKELIFHLMINNVFFQNKAVSKKKLIWRETTISSKHGKKGNRTFAHGEGIKSNVSFFFFFKYLRIAGTVFL